MIIFGEVHLRPPPMAEIGEPRSGDPGFRHQLNVLSRELRHRAHRTSIKRPPTKRKIGLSRR